jgi:hypothetical protein
LISSDDSNAVKVLDSPVFLVGAERSGTTLLRLLLSHHPNIAFWGESEFFVDYIKGEQFPDLKEYYDILENDRVFRSRELFIDKNLSYPELIIDFLDQFSSRGNRTKIACLGATVHRNFDKLPLLFPRARFLHIIRDPRDVARSCIGMGWAGNVWTGVRKWREVESAWERFHPMLSTENQLTIHYESLIKEPKKSLKTICKWIGVPYSEKMFEYAENSPYDPIDPNLVNQWQKKLTTKEVGWIESGMIDLMEARGYTAQTNGAQVPAFTRYFLQLQDRLFRVRFTIKRIGLQLWLEGLIARRLGGQRWQNSVQLRCNEIANRYLK